MPAAILVLVFLLTVSAVTLATISWQLSLLAVVGMLIAPIAWRRPEFVLVSVALLLPSGVVFLPLRVQIGPTFFTVLQITIFAVAALSLFKPGATRAGYHHPLFRFGAAFALAGTLTALLSENPSSALGQVLTVGGLLMAISVALADRFERNPASVHHAVIYIGTAVAALACYEALIGHAVLETLYQTQRGYVPSGVYFRPPSTMGNALIASSAFVGIFAFTLTSSHVKWRHFCLAVLGTAALFELSRSSTIIIAGTIIIYIALGAGKPTSQDRRRRMLIAASAIPATLFAIIFVGPRLAARLSGRGLESPVRAYNAGLAFEQWQDHRLTGMGLGGFRRFAETTATTALSTIDNQYLTLLVELGLVGVLILLWGCRGAILSREPGRSWLPLAAMLAAGMFFDILSNDATVFLVAVSAITAVTTRPLRARSNGV